MILNLSRYFTSYQNYTNYFELLFSSFITTKWIRKVMKVMGLLLQKKKKKNKIVYTKKKNKTN